jgi:hypothetical protein
VWWADLGSVPTETVACLRNLATRFYSIEWPVGSIAEAFDEPI